jgi:hypothetical protein
MNLDSVGNLMPQEIILSTSFDTNKTLHALAVNSFLLAAKVAMSKGCVVVYDPNAKTAKITDRDGSISVISHS